MYKQLIRLAVAAAGITLATGAVAQMSIEDAIKTRQSGYTYMSWNLGTIKALAVDKAAPYDQARVARAADVIAAIANSGMGALYPPGSGQGTGWKTTRLDPVFFEQLDKVGEIATNFVAQANKMQEVAHNSDQQAVAAQFRELAAACKSCHEKYRLPD